jgi:hypothetical protein
MRLLTSFIIIFLASLNAFSQNGRNELPQDTLPIGGQQQEVKMTQMEAQDQLASELTSLRDSVTNYLAEHKSTTSVQGKANTSALTKYKTQIDELIDQMKKTEKDEALVKRGYTLLHDTRAEFNSLRTKQQR